MRSIRWIICLALALLLSAAGAGCRSADVEVENDRLRAANLDLEDRIRALESRNGELAADLHRVLSAPAALPEAVRQATPRVAGIEIDSLSHACDDDGDGVPEAILVYVKSHDGRERFIQLVGELVINATMAHGKGPARTVGTVMLDPPALRDAYRSGFMGTHYSVEVPIDTSTVREGDLEIPCVVCVTFTDGLTGQIHTAQRAITLINGG